MSSEVFYPYITATPEIIQLDLQAADSGQIEVGDESLKIFSQETADVTLSASVLIPSMVWSVVFPSEDLSDPPADVILVFTSIESRHRRAYRLDGDGTVYERSFSLSRQDWIGVVEIQAKLIRSTTDTHLSEKFGAGKGTLLAWSRSIRVLFDPPPMPPGAHIEVKWHPFDEGNSWLQRHAHHLFALDTSGPLLYMNSNVSKAVPILDSRATHGTSARIRDATNFMIAHQVWSSLLASAMNYWLLNQEPDDELSELNGLDDSWEKTVLRDWAPYLFPEADPEVAERDFHSTVGENEGREDILMRRFPTAIQQRLETFKGFEGLVREIGRQ